MRNARKQSLAHRALASKVGGTGEHRKRKHKHTPEISKRKVLRAIKGTGGVKTKIVERLGCSYCYFLTILKRPHWEDIREAIREEMDQVADLAEGTVRDAIEQRLDIGTALKASTWLLTRARHKDRQMGDESKVTLEGGDKPIQVSKNVSVESLDLPIEVKRQILAAVEAQDEEENEE